ncbi:MAG: hypothetical protein KatS3mg001_022 [Candidatus Pacearchaeota archaeon]|nr:MAG: hypothetical protein KatS3mg001_022 [Candidatus Pacearchaeota archaeon]
MKKEIGKKFLALLGLILLVIIIISVFYLFSLSKNTVDLAFSFFAGISMIVLPCTFPLVLIIVPLAMGKGYKKGLGMALLFSFGLIITLSIYGIFIASIGNIIGLDEAIEKANSFSRILFMIGGTAAILFGLSELGLLRFELPHYMGTPKFIEKRKDYSKAFFLGLFLGNAGVACPNPLFYVLLGDIAIKGNVFFGWWMGFVHGLGRATPLIFLAIFGILGVNATSSIMKHQEKIKKGVGWFLIILGAIIFIIGGAHEWYEENIVHKGWNKIVSATGLPSELMGEEHEHEGVGDIIPDSAAMWLLIALIVIPIIWYYSKFKIKKRWKNGKSSDFNHTRMHGMRKS